MGDSRSLTIRFVRQDGLVAQVHAEPGKAVTVGRDLGCDVRLDGRKVSRRHARIDNRGDGDVRLTDINSHNGTYVNGQRITECALSEGDVVQAGEWEGRVELRSAAAGATRTQVPWAQPALQPGMMPAFDPNASTAKHNADVVSAAALLAKMTLDAPLPPPTHRTGESFDGVTDPQAPSLKGKTASAPAPPLSSLPPPPISQSGNRTPARVTGILSTRIADLGAFDFEEAAPPLADALRAAKVEDNPIVRRFTESQVNLDFRGLTELRDMGDVSGGLRPAQGIDSIALRLVFKVTEALATSDSMDQFLREMSDSLCSAARAKAVLVLLPDESTGELVPRVVKLRRPDEKVQLSRTVIEHAVRNKSALTTEDAAADERFARGESVLRFDLKAVLCVPLLRGADVVGAIYLTRDLPFSNTERDLVAALAHLIAMGLDRSRLREEYAQADRTRRSLERFHAPDVVRRLMMESTVPVAARGDGLFLEPLQATVLFCDLAGFTKYCEGQDAEHVAKLLNAYLGTMTEIVFAHGGTVDKFIGDAIMCIFGAPFMSPDDPVRAVRCAIDMRSSFRALVQSGQVGEAARHLDVHIGVNTGKVVAGTVGSPRRMEYTALGDTVNTASRLEGVAKGGEIVIGPVTAAAVEHEIKLLPRGPVTLKGKSETLEVFTVPEVQT